LGRGTDFAYFSIAAGEGGPMIGETGVAHVWAALLGLCFVIAVTITIGTWLWIYHQEAVELQPYLVEPTTAAKMILDDIPFLRR
jgi:hypothetical protein